MYEQTNTLSPQLINSDKHQVERILQLARLGSDPVAIDPLLDGLRAVTSQWDGKTPLSSESQIKLKTIEVELKNYLVNKDPLRSFTSTDLESMLQTSDSTQSATSPRDIILVLLYSLLVAGSAFLLPVFSNFPVQKSILLFIPLFFVGLHIGIAWFYLSALKNFKQELKNAFILICIGLVLLSIAFSHYTLLELFGASQLELFKYGGITILDAACYFFIYLGLRQYAKLVGVKNFATSLKNLAIASALVILAAFLVPHGGNAGVELFFDIGLSGIWLFSLYIAFCLAVTSKIVKSVTPAYAKSMKWLHIYFIFGFLGALVSAIALPIIGELNGGFLFLLIAIAGLPPQLLLLYTGYLFKKETSTT